MMIKIRSSNSPWLSLLPNCSVFIFVIVFSVACGGTDNNTLFNVEPSSDAVPASTVADNQSTNMPSNPNADPGAIRLLDYLNEITGQQVLSGQEQLFWDNEREPFFPSRQEQYVFDQVSKYPAVYSTGFGAFHLPGDDADLDLRNLIVSRRGEVVDAVIAHAAGGSIIQLDYNMIAPSRDDGAGVQDYRESAYSPQNIDDMLTNGSALNLEYENRLDEIAGYLTLLRNEGIPVLWRPFQAMNAPRFWWGQKSSFEELWQHQWRYFTEVHNLTNLIWVYSVNHWGQNSGPQWDSATYHPGHQFVDVLGVEIFRQFGHDFDQYVYDALLLLGEQRPIAITENGQMPDLASLRNTQPRWVYWSTWSGEGQVLEEGENPQNSQNLYIDNYVILDDYVITRDETELF